MREIKFRAWDTNDGKMHVVRRIDLLPPSPYLPSVTFLDGYLDEPVPICEVKLMQYTGLKDKNGVEIYEGDIRKLPNGDIEVVKYFEQYTRFALSNNNEPNALPMRIVDMTNTEYLGNICENPDLLGGARCERD